MITALAVAANADDTSGDTAVAELESSMKTFTETLGSADTAIKTLLQALARFGNKGTMGQYFSAMATSMKRVQSKLKATSSQMNFFNKQLNKGLDTVSANMADVFVETCMDLKEQLETTLDGLRQAIQGTRIKSNQNTNINISKDQVKSVTGPLEDMSKIIVKVLEMKLQTETLVANLNLGTGNPVVPAIQKVLQEYSDSLTSVNDQVQDMSKVLGKFYDGGNFADYLKTVG